jgi:two-component system, LytTR family, response regulator
MNAIIVEDEAKSADVLRKLITLTNPNVTIVAVANNVKDALQHINELQPDLVFMDIELPDGTGFDVLEKVAFKNFSVIFTTAYDSFAVRAFKYNAIDYLLKPIDSEELEIAIKKVTIQTQLTPTRVNNIVEAARNSSIIKKITLPTGTAYEIIALEDIIRCEADTSYTKFFLKDGKRYIVSNSLKHYEDLLPQDKFVRIHHHHLINIDHVVRVLKEDGGYAIMSDNSKIEISRRKKENLFEYLQKL